MKFPQRNKLQQGEGRLRSRWLIVLREASKSKGFFSRTHTKIQAYKWTRASRRPLQFLVWLCHKRTSCLHCSCSLLHRVWYDVKLLRLSGAVTQNARIIVDGCCKFTTDTFAMLLFPLFRRLSAPSFRSDVVGDGKSIRLTGEQHGRHVNCV